jgi:hypothetical protein
MSKLFRRGQTSALGALVTGLQMHLAQSGQAAFASKADAGRFVAMEGISDVDLGNLQRATSDLKSTLSSVLTAAGEHIKVGSVAMESAQVAAMLSADPTAVVNHKVVQPKSTPNDVYIPARSEVPRMREAMEAYDEKENRNAAVYSVAYNMMASRQSEFGEALFPTVVVDPSQVGYTVSIQLVQVNNEVRRNINGNVDQFNRKNIVHAVRDPSILANSVTKVVPVFRTGANDSSDKFVDDALMPAKTVDLNGEAVMTSALAFNTPLSLIGLSQTDALLAAGVMDSTDALDSALALQALYVRLDGATDEVISFNVRKAPRAVFNHTVQGNYRQMQLNFTTKSLKVDKDKKKYDGAASTILAPVVSGDYTVQLGVSVNGEVNLETGELQLLASKVIVVSVTDSAGVVHTPDSAPVAAIVALFNGAQAVGFDLDARRTNSNRRQRGQLLDVTQYNQHYAVPLLSPITTPRPLGQGDQTDASDLAALITATRIRTDNDAVRALLDADALLGEFVKGNEQIGDTPEVMGVARFITTPYYESKDFDAAVVTNSTKSSEKDADIQGALVSLLRNMAFRMYTDSGYKAAADALSGGNAPTPTIVIATDPVIARYLNIFGDIRLLGDSFNVKVVSTLNIQMRGKLFMTFGAYEGTEGAPNPLHFGNMAWKPELVLVLPLHRNGGNSKELTVQPSYEHIVNLPILARVDVTGLTEFAEKKTAINFKEIV